MKGSIAPPCSWFLQKANKITKVITAIIILPQFFICSLKSHILVYIYVLYYINLTKNIRTIIFKKTAYLWKLSTILSCPRRSFLVRWSSMRASTRHSMKVLRYWGRPRLGSHSLPIHSWFISPNASVCNQQQSTLACYCWYF